MGAWKRVGSVISPPMWSLNDCSRLLLMCSEKERRGELEVVPRTLKRKRKRKSASSRAISVLVCVVVRRCWLLFQLRSSHLCVSISSQLNP